MALGFGFDLMSQATRQRPWTPRFLFGNGEEGAWYDPSDFSTLYQDSAGTTPVTQLGQPVGLMLDKSQGAVVSGPELVTNGTFDTDSDWTKGTGWSISGGVASCDGTQVSSTSLFQSNTGIEIGKLYEISYSISRSAGGWRIFLGGNNSTALSTSSETGSVFLYRLSGSANEDITIQGDASFVGTVDNISVREIPGNHASQSTSTARPTVQARVNLLERTEEFDNPYWSAARVTPSVATGVTPPINAGNVYLIEQNTGETFAGYIAETIATTGAATTSVFAKANGKSHMIILTGSSRFTWFNLGTGTVATVDPAHTASIIDYGNGWYRCSVTTTDVSDNAIFYPADTDNSFTVADSGGIYLWGAQLEVGSAATTYQRVTTATDYADVGAPRYLEFDGVDDVINIPIPTGGITGDSIFGYGEGIIPAGFTDAAGTLAYGGQYISDDRVHGIIITDDTWSSGEESAVYAYMQNRGAAGLDGWGDVTDFTNGWRGQDYLTSFPLIDTSSGTTFNSAWFGCDSLTSFPLIDTSSGTNFFRTWNGCSSLTSFPLIDTSSGTNFSYAWYNCNSLTSFSLIDTSSGTNFYAAWFFCTSLTAFPLINTSNGTSFFATWYNCNSLTSFPLLDTSSGTTFSQAWQNCSSLTNFPANFFDSWSATPANSCFVNAWDGCTSLTPTSVVNILTSLDTSGVSAPASGVDITIDYAGGDISAASTAITNLKGRGWTVTINGVPQ